MEHGRFLLCTLCCASFRRDEDGRIRFNYQFSGNKHIRDFMEVLDNEMRSDAEKAEEEVATESA